MVVNGKQNKSNNRQHTSNARLQWAGGDSVLLEGCQLTNAQFTVTCFGTQFSRVEGGLVRDTIVLRSHMAPTLIITRVIDTCMECTVYMLCICNYFHNIIRYFCHLKQVRICIHIHIAQIHTYMYICTSTCKMKFIGDNIPLHKQICSYISLIRI